VNPVHFVIYNYTFLGRNGNFITIAAKKLKRKKINGRKIVYPLGVKIRVNPPSINLRWTSPCQKTKTLPYPSTLLRTGMAGLLIPVKLMLIEIVLICHSCASSAIGRPGESPENVIKMAVFPLSGLLPNIIVECLRLPRPIS